MLWESVDIWVQGMSLKLVPYILMTLNSLNWEHPVIIGRRQLAFVLDGSCLNDVEFEEVGAFSGKVSWDLQ